MRAKMDKINVIEIETKNKDYVARQKAKIN